MGDVVNFRGFTLSDISAEQILESVDRDLKDIMVIGEDSTKHLSVQCTTSDLGHALILIERAKQQIMEIINENCD